MEEFQMAADFLEFVNFLLKRRFFKDFLYQGQSIQDRPQKGYFVFGQFNGVFLLEAMKRKSSKMITKSIWDRSDIFR